MKSNGFCIRSVSIESLESDISKSKSKSKKTLFNVGQSKQYNISSHLKWVLVADKSMHMIIYNKIHIKSFHKRYIHKAQ